MPDAREEVLREFDEAPGEALHWGNQYDTNAMADEIVRLREQARLREIDCANAEAENATLRAARDAAQRERDALKAKLYDAEYDLAGMRENERAQQRWLDRAKESRGYHPNVSFDVVWAETTAKLDAAEAQRDAAQAQLANVARVEAWMRDEAFTNYVAWNEEGFELSRSLRIPVERIGNAPTLAALGAALPAAEGEG